MIRRNSGLIAAALVVVAASGCGGKHDDGELFRQRTALSARFGGLQAQPVYFNVTNALHLAGPSSLASFQLVAGARVELEMATEDGKPLRFELHRIRKDGTTEMIAPVDVTSGFYLTHFEASSDGEFALYFPALREPDTTVIVYMGCESGEGRCSPARQPNETCAPGYACDRGLDCILPSGSCDVWIEFGRCEPRPAACDASADRACSCDGQTFPSECMARSTGANVAHGGDCQH